MEDEGMILAAGTAANRPFFIGVDSLTLSATISKNGGAFAATGTPGLTFLSGGWYNLALDTTDTGTPGSLAYIISGVGMPVASGYPVDQVVSNPFPPPGSLPLVVE